MSSTGSNDKEVSYSHNDSAIPSPGLEKGVGAQEVALSPVAHLSDPDAGKSDAERAAIDRKLLWRLDRRLIPWLCVLYLMAFLDRTNIGNAKIDNMPKDLGLSPGQYNATLSIFFVSYAVFEPLTNVLLKKFKPSVFIPVIMFLWGLMMTLMGIAQNYSGLMALRWFLGVFEAGLFPGVNYYLSCWYRRSEFGLRAAIFFSAAALSGSFGGLLAAAIIKMAGVAGLEGWRWIFILEGIVTVLLGVASYWIIVDFPDDSTFLSPDDKLRVTRRLLLDNQASAERENWSKKAFFGAILDWKMWLGMAIYMGADMPLYAFSLFLPTIVSNLHIGNGSVVTNQLLSVPPYAGAAIMTVLIGFAADKTNRRGIYNVGCSLIGIAGFAMLLGSGTTQYAVKYAGTFLGAIGIYPCIANTIAWTSNNVEGVYKRGIVLGFVIGWGNLNGVVSSNIFQASNAPNYRIGHGIIMGYMIVFLLGGSALQWYLLARENKARDQGKRDHVVEGLSPAEVRGLGDKVPNFRYKL